MDGVYVRLRRDDYTDNLEMMLIEYVGGKAVNILRPTPDSQWAREPLREGERQRASIVFSETVARTVMESLAQQLAQLGFVQLNAAPQMGAMGEHIKDLQTANTRLFALAEKAMQ